MNDKIGLLSYRMDRDAFDKPYSNETARMIDDEVGGSLTSSTTHCTEVHYDTNARHMSSGCTSRCICFDSITRHHQPEVSRLGLVRWSFSALACLPVVVYLLLFCC